MRNERFSRSVPFNRGPRQFPPSKLHRPRLAIKPPRLHARNASPNLQSYRAPSFHASTSPVRSAPPELHAFMPPALRVATPATRFVPPYLRVCTHAARLKSFRAPSFHSSTSPGSQRASRAPCLHASGLPRRQRASTPPYLQVCTHAARLKSF